MTMTMKAQNKTPAKTLLKLEYLRATLEGEARFAEKHAKRLNGLEAAIRGEGRAAALYEAEDAGNGHTFEVYYCPRRKRQVWTTITPNGVRIV